MNYEKEEGGHSERNDYYQFQVLVLMKVEEVMQQVRHRNVGFDEGFDQLWHLLSNDN